ncbi:MAG: hypothetical protein NXH82_13880 [Rhodobacteraceae bacterium]|nr:hypothetical protein [Paracoccaceae bacterium]
MTKISEQPRPEARNRPVEMVRSVIGWVIENDRRFRMAQSMVDRADRGF